MGYDHAIANRRVVVASCWRTAKTKTTRLWVQKEAADE